MTEYRFSGPQKRGIMREVRRRKRKEAEDRNKIYRQRQAQEVSKQDESSISE